jgi:CRISPR-associated endonuclease/helicase Cas3
VKFFHCDALWHNDKISLQQRTKISYYYYLSINHKMTLMEPTISHIKKVSSSSQTQKWKIQTNQDHSEGVAKLAARFASEFHMEEWGKAMGMLHDKGKEPKLFQDHIKFSSGYDISIHCQNNVKHAYIGALIAKRQYPSCYPLICYPILGHHAGLTDYMDFDNYMKMDIPSDVSIPENAYQLAVPNNLHLSGKEQVHHLIRMLYSCLVDADFLDTESFMDEKHSSLRGSHTSLADLLPLLENHLSKLTSKAPDTEVNRIRKEIQDQCILESEQGVSGFYSLSVPTGGGKTLSSILWAIHHAIKFGKKRIIIAIPYTSIIIQTAQILREIFGDENVLEHHSENDVDLDDENQDALKLRLATENWDYPIIVTTNVQLFESIFSNRPSSCRKLHNICNSVLILDEVQSLPISFLQPIIDSLKAYQAMFGVSILFTTASLPAIKGDHGNSQSTFHGIQDIYEIIPDSFKLHDKLRRVKLIFDNKISNYDEIANRIIKHNKVLCVVNTRKDAKELFNRLPKEGITIHLSRMMCASHIREAIMRIKKALKDGEKVVRVISTQLIEAGVDIDFPIVFRQEAGLDSLLQAAGRCNREGKNGLSDVYVFSLGHLPFGYISHANDARKNLVDITDWFDRKTMEKYFIELFKRTPSFDENGISDLLYKPFDFCFKTASESFKLITDDTISIIVNYKESPILINELEEEGPSYSLMKKLNQFSVNVRKKDFDELVRYQLVEEKSKGVYYLTKKEQYDENIGLIVNNTWLDEVLMK